MRLSASRGSHERRQRRPLLLKRPGSEGLAFERGCTPISGAPRHSNTSVCSTPRALLAGRIDALGARVTSDRVPTTTRPLAAAKLLVRFRL